jgi:nucleotide-binding universal stress UspA family protein
MYHKIVAGVDDESHGRDAAVLAEALAESCDADLMLVSAFQNPLLPFPPTMGSHRGAEARATLSAVRPGSAPRAHTLTVADVSPARALRRTIEDHGADLLVVGSGGDPTPGRVHLGRTGRVLVHNIDCALAIAPHAMADSAFALRRIVVGVDGSPGSCAALAAARELAAAAGAELTVVGVVDETVPVSLTPFGVVADLAQWDEAIAARRAHLVERLATVLGPDGPAAEIRVGGPDAELDAAAAGADLLVIGARRGAGPKRAVLGSTADALCEEATCPLLIVPLPADEDSHA